MESLYDRLGGKAAIEAAVDIFYDKVMKDDRINHFFKNSDMKNQRGKQKLFLTVAFGGPNNYSGKSMREGHAHLKLEDKDFDAVIENLGATLVELKVPEALIGECAKIAESTRNDVLNR